MFQTIMAVPMLVVQGRYALLTQQDSDDKKKKRHVIINSDTLAVRGTYEGENGKAAFEAEIAVIIAEGTSKTVNPLEQMLSGADETVTDETVADEQSDG